MKMNENAKREVIHIDSFKQEKIKLKVCAYVRVSSDSEDQQNSFDTQLTYYHNLINKHEEWQMVDIYCDEGVSGQGTKKREGFNQMIDDCKKGKIDRILTKSISRFARNTEDALKAIRLLKELRISVYFEKENIDTADLQGEVLLTTFTCFAQEELESISQNIKIGNRIRMRNGTYVSSAVPYGYRLENNQMVIHEQESNVIKRIFTDYLNGKGLHTIAKDLREDRIKTPSGNDKWGTGTISRLLKNERFKGDALLQKNYSPDIFPLKSIKNNGELPMYYVKNNHEGIIPIEIFDKAQEMLNEKYVVTTQTTVYPLTRKIRCGNCNTNFRRIVISEKEYWVCHTHNRGKENCSVTAVSQEDVYNAFIKMYHKLKENYEYILTPMLKALTKLRDNQYRGNHTIEQLNKDIATISEQSHTLNGLINQGVLDSAIFITKRDELRKRLRTLKHEKSTQMQGDKDATVEQTEELISILEDSVDYLTEFDEELMNELVSEIIAYDDRTIGFILINGLELKETIKQARR